MVIKKSFILNIGFFLFYLYALPVRWTDIDNQAFAKLGASDSYGGEIISRQIGTPMFLLFILLFAWQVPKAVAIIPRGFYMAFLLPLLSVLWTIDTFRTVNALIVLCITVLICALCVRIFGVKVAITRFWQLSVGLLVVSAVLGVIGDSHVMMFSTHEGSWRGLFNHKNGFGPFIGLVVLITVFGNEIIEQRRHTRVAVLLLSLCCFYMASSSAAIISTAVAFAVCIIALAQPRSRTLRTILYTVGISMTGLAAYWAFAYLDAITELAGRDLTLTGRTELWQAALPYTRNAPFGYGFGTGGGEQVIEAMRVLSGWGIAASTHNVYITRALDVGWYGVALMLLWVVPMIIVADTSEMKAEKILLSGVAALHLVGGMAEATGLLFTNAAFVLILILSSGIRMREAAPLLQQTGVVIKEPALSVGLAGAGR